MGLKEEITNLTLDEIAGILTAEDKERLSKWIAQDPQARLIWEGIHRELGPDALKEAHESLKENPVERIFAAERKRRAKVLLLKSVSIAAAVVILFLAVSRLFVQRQTTGETGRLAISKAGPMPVLRLADGEEISLDVNSSEYKIPGAVLHNANKTLSFISAGTQGSFCSLYIPAGQDYNLQLADGTELQLNSATTVQFPFNFEGRTREINIEGEAFLKVARDPVHPFIVHMGNRSVRVLGTSFNVNTYDSSSIRVSLVEGSVNMKSGGDSLLLKPGFQILSTSVGMKMEPFDAETVLSWRAGKYDFNAGATFKDIALMISKWYSVKVVFDDEKTAGMKFYGVLHRGASLENFLQTLTRVEPFTYRFEKDSVLHLK